MALNFVSMVFVDMNRELVKRLADHVGVAQALWRMRSSASSASQLAIVRLIGSAIHAHFVRKLVRSVVGFLIPGLMPSQFWV